MLISKKTTLALCAALAMAGAGCGDDDDGNGDAGATTDTVTATTERDPVETTDTTESEPAEEGEPEGAEPEPGEDTGTTSVGGIGVRLTEFDVRVAKKRLANEGVYTFNVVNEGRIAHALASEGPNGKTRTDEIPAGESAQLDVYFVAGEYRLYCPIGNHEQRGMRSRLRVG